MAYNNNEKNQIRVRKESESGALSRNVQWTLNRGCFDFLLLHTVFGIEYFKAGFDRHLGAPLTSFVFNFKYFIEFMLWIESKLHFKRVATENWLRDVTRLNISSFFMFSFHKLRFTPKKTSFLFYNIFILVVDCTFFGIFVIISINTQLLIFLYIVIPKYIHICISGNYIWYTWSKRKFSCLLT